MARQNDGDQIMSVEEYLEFEERAPFRHEYVQGRVLAMTGASDFHNVICVNLVSMLNGLLKGSGCRVYVNEMKVRIEVADCFYYPDIMVTCEPVEAKKVFKSSPKIVIEVLSPSTKRRDRGEKLLAYRQLDSLQYYVLIHQNKKMVEMYHKISDKHWECEKLGVGEHLSLDGACNKALLIAVEDIYEGIELPSIVSEEEEDYELA